MDGKVESFSCCTVFMLLESLKKVQFSTKLE